MFDYLQDRKQRVKISNSRSSSKQLTKGVPRGSILGHFLFNVFMNDLFLFMKNCKLYNYADDNSVMYSSPDLFSIISNLKIDCKNAIEHVSACCSKAAKQLNALSRISRHISLKSKSIIYNSFIASNFNYCPLVWHFCGATNSNKLEKLRERSLRRLCIMNSNLQFRAL